MNLGTVSAGRGVPINRLNKNFTWLREGNRFLTVFGEIKNQQKNVK